MKFKPPGACVPPGAVPTKLVTAATILLALAGSVAALPGAAIDLGLASALLPAPPEAPPVDAPAASVPAPEVRLDEPLAAPTAELAAPKEPRPRDYVVLTIERRAEIAAAIESLQDPAAPPIAAKIATIAVSPDAEREAPREILYEPARTDRAPASLATASAGPADAPGAGETAAALAAGLAIQTVWVAMYHRIAPSKALAGGPRQPIHAEVARRGHATAGDVAGALGLHPKTAKYHLDMLVKLGLLHQDPDGAYRLPGVRRASEPTLDDAILELVATRPGLSMTDVARDLAVSKSTAQERVTQLLIERRLESRRDEGKRALFPLASLA